MGKGKIHDRTSLPSFALLCAAASIGILAAQHQVGVKDFSSEPSLKSDVYTEMIMANSVKAPDAAFTELAIGGTRVEFGHRASVEFSTDGHGAGSIGMTLAKRSGAEGVQRVMVIGWQMDPKTLNYMDGSRIEVSGLAPNARYRIEVGFLQSVAREGSSVPAWGALNPSNFYPECAGSCAASFGRPVLVDVKADSMAAAIEKVEVRSLGQIPWASPLLLALGLVLWRAAGAGMVRKSKAALGMESDAPMPVKSPKAG